MKPTAETRSATENMEARVTALEAELKQARDEMRAFSYSVSHDLRAPIRAIEGFTRIVEEDYGKALDDEGRKYLQHVIQNAQVMGALIEGLLNYHRLNERNVSKASVDMASLTREALAALPKSATAPEVKIQNLPTISADPVLMRTAWEHLLSNALKFSKKNPHPEVTVGAEIREGENVLWVKDNGIGFDMQYSDKLFQIFQKLQKDAEFEGHGVGLAMVRRVAEKHKGRVWAEATPEKGATFYLALPK